MADLSDRRADTTRQQILRAAARQFAQRSYHDVGLDDILADAELTKGAMYFHFRSKHALALAVIEEQLTVARAGVGELIGRNLSGLETLIDIGYWLAVEDINSDPARAVLQLLPVVGVAEGLQDEVLADATRALTRVAERAAAEGDLLAERDPQDAARLLIWLYLGVRQSADLDRPEQFLGWLEKSWVLALPTLVPAEKAGYFGQFLRRRTALALRATAAATDPAVR